jgi:hypothetical protein
MVNSLFDEAFEQKSGGSKMDQNQSRSGGMQNNLIDTTDCLEAIEVLRSWKNFLFVIIIICLLLIQLSFWLTKTNVIKTKHLQEQTENVTAANEPANPYQPKMGYQTQNNAFGQSHETAPIAAEDANSLKHPAQQAETKVKKTLAFLSKIDFEELSWLINFLNFVLLLSAFLYCLSMLFILKISLVGRLGGINHITRAFFLSLAFVVFIIPWQLFFKEVLAGAIYMPKELLQALTDIKEMGLIGQVYLYLRYVIYWVIVFFFVISAQTRSARWTKASLRRLEVV